VPNWLFFFLNSATSSSRVWHLPSSFCFEASAVLISGFVYHSSSSLVASSFLFYSAKVAFWAANWLHA
jgi:hypothetical protein